MCPKELCPQPALVLMPSLFFTAFEDTLFMSLIFWVFAGKLVKLVCVGMACFAVRQHNWVSVLTQGEEFLVDFCRKTLPNGVRSAAKGRVDRCPARAAAAVSAADPTFRPKYEKRKRGWRIQKSKDIFLGNATNETYEIKVRYKSVNKVESRWINLDIFT